MEKWAARLYQFSWSRERGLAFLILLGFALVYAAISLVNHYYFRTFAFDLGIKNQVIWDYAHLRPNYNTVMDELGGRVNVLANHYEPVLWLISPFWYIFGSYTLLVVQIAAILGGAWGVYTWICLRRPEGFLPHVGMLYFLSLWGTFAALSYDFHSNVIGAMLVPWFFVALEKNKPLQAIFWLFLVASTKENMALWAAFIALGTTIWYWRVRLYRWLLPVLALGMLAYFLLIMQVIMPYFAGDQLAYLHFKYSALGATMSEAVHTIITRPGYVFWLLFNNHLPGAETFPESAKSNLHGIMLLSGGFVLLWRPAFLVMLMPIYAQKMFSDDPSKWSVFVHYSIEFVPILSFAVFHEITRIKPVKIASLLACIAFLAALDAAKDTIDVWKPLPHGKNMNNFYQKAHYQRSFDVHELHRALTQFVQPHHAISATSFVVPHVANRKQIQYFPNMQQANLLILVDDGEVYFPLTRQQFVHQRDSLMQHPDWHVVYNQNQTVILAR